MAVQNLPDAKKFVGLRLQGDFMIQQPLSEGPARGKNGIVYEGTQSIAGHENKVAIKCIPQSNLRSGWDSEIRKPLLLPVGVRVVRPVSVVSFTPPGETGSFVFVVMPWIKGVSLRTYIEKYPERISYVFCQRLAQEMLAFLHSLQSVEISHGDIHPGNIIVELPDDRYLDAVENFWLVDFGVGNSLNDLKPKDDFFEVGAVIQRAITTSSVNAVDGEARHVLDCLANWLVPKLQDTNPSLIGYRDAKYLARELGSVLAHSARLESKAPQKLATPFDYMSCEQLGEQYGLLQRLFSLNFPNCPDLLEACNTVLTGPRGCGKTMILRSLATKSQVLGGKTLSTPIERFGIYYHCNDLFYAFPYLKKNLDERLLRGTVHFFNLSILHEVLDSLATISAASTALQIPDSVVRTLADWITEQLPQVVSHSRPLEVLLDLKAQVGVARKQVKNILNHATLPLPSNGVLGLDFIAELAAMLRRSVPWLQNVPIILFLDDYSTPRVSGQLQASLNRVIFQRSSEVFFKLSTESITTLHPYDSDGKLLEVEREYSVIDMGTAFMNADQEGKARFLEEVINTRFDVAEAYSLPRIRELLGDAEISYNEMAREIRKSSAFKFHGFGTLVDMCSGDITHTLRLVRDMAASSGWLERNRKDTQHSPVKPISAEIQHKAINKLGADFLASIEAAPQHGPRIRQIVEAFGESAHWELMNIDSPNESSAPPKQAFRIEIRDSLRFDNTEIDLADIYSTLLRYGVFIRDVTGKSVRSSVVPRLYLRRLVVPLFRLTFSRRDNVGLNVDEFKTLLRDPERFKSARMRKRSGDATLALNFKPGGKK